MESIIILILFTYPGAAADYLHSIMIRGKQYDKPAEGYFRTARDFFLSAIITLVAMALFCPMRSVPFTLDGAAEALHSGKGLWIFAALTLIGAVAAAGIWAAGNECILRARNNCQQNSKKPTISENRSVWASMMTDKDIPFIDGVAAIYKDRKLIRAGMLHNVTDDAQDDPWVILKWTETAEAELQLPVEKRKLLSDPFYSFVNISNGVTVDLYNGKKFGQFIDDYLKSEEALAADEEKRDCDQD